MKGPKTSFGVDVVVDDVVDINNNTALVDHNMGDSSVDVFEPLMDEAIGGGDGGGRNVDVIQPHNDEKSITNVDVNDKHVEKSTTLIPSNQPQGRYANMEIKFKASLKDRRKIVKALNEKNSLMIGKIEIIKGIQKKIANHEKMVSMKAVENQKLVKAIESLNKNFNATVKDLEETKNTVKALND
ncbi:hypothetical protein JHK82_043932 [Glycine max]|nr:hypothetical protein JHK82_043932 [Glycine max]